MVDTERAFQEYKHYLTTYPTPASAYAACDNRLRKAADGDDWDEIEFLQAVCKRLKDYIVIDYMYKNDYHLENNTGMPVWEKL